jgi:hypothetical protein
MLARRLTSAGIAQFEEWLHGRPEDASRAVPRELLTADATSEALEVEIDATPRSFQSRLDVAEHLQLLLKSDVTTLRVDNGFWTWLALHWFEELCPHRGGVRRPGHSARWIARLQNPRRACRHLLAGPYQVLRAHRDDPARAMSLLCGRPAQGSPLVTWIASRPSLVTCPAVVGAATRLYYDAARGRNRRNLEGREPGSPRRFADLLSQLDLTWDLHSLSVEQLLELLPAEFDRFRRPASRQRPLIE